MLFPQLLILFPYVISQSYDRGSILAPASQNIGWQQQQYQFRRLLRRFQFAWCELIQDGLTGRENQGREERLLRYNVHSLDDLLLGETYHLPLARWKSRLNESSLQSRRTKSVRFHVGCPCEIVRPTLEFQKHHSSHTNQQNIFSSSLACLCFINLHEIFTSKCIQNALYQYNSGKYLFQPEGLSSLAH